MTRQEVRTFVLDSCKYGNTAMRRVQCSVGLTVFLNIKPVLLPQMQTYFHLGVELMSLEV